MDLSIRSILCMISVARTRNLANNLLEGAKDLNCFTQNAILGENP